MIRDQLAVFIEGVPGKIGELIVEEHPAHHARRAKNAFDTGGHRHHITPVIDHYKMGSTRPIVCGICPKSGTGGFGRLEGPGVSRGYAVDRFFWIDQFGPSCEVGLIEHAL